MKLSSVFAIFTAAIAGFAAVNAQQDQFEYFNEPTLLWEGTTTDDASGLGVQEGNGLYLSPGGSMLVSTSLDGTVRAFNPTSGDVLWTYQPPSVGLSVRCYSGVTFNAEAATPYMVYAIADGDAETRVIALDMDGQEIFQSSSLPGIAAGTPVTDSSGDHILLTHNAGGEIGYLSILLVPGAATPEEPVFQGTYQDDQDGTIVEKPFSPIGVFHNPAEGYYEGGQGNTNDMFLFCWDTPSSATVVGDTDGRIFGVQFPTDYTGNGQGLSFFPLGGLVDFQSSNPPVLTNEGRSYYWSVTKSSQYNVVGVEALPRWYFDRTRITQKVAFARAQNPFPRYLAGRSVPTLSSDPAQPTVFGVSASTELWTMDYLYTQQSLITVNTPDIVSSKVLLTPREDFVLYGTQALSTAGTLHMLSADRLQEEWQIAFPGGVAGDMALDKNGAVVFAANPAGAISAYQFGLDSNPSASPTMSPTNAEPTLGPTTAAPVTLAPTPAVTTAAPIDVPSDSPSSPPTAEPTTAAPTVSPTTAAPTMSAMPTTETRAPTLNPTDSPTVAPTTAAPTTAFPTISVPDETLMPTPGDSEILEPTSGAGSMSIALLAIVVSAVAAFFV